MYLALGDAFNLWRMNAVQLILVLLLLVEHALRQRKLLVEFGVQIRIIKDVAQNIAVHPAQIGLQPPDLLLRPLELPRMRVCAGPPQGIRAKSSIALPKPDPVLFRLPH